MIKTKVLQCDETELQYYLNKGWEIITSVPNPYPQPRVYFYIKKMYEYLPPQEEFDLIYKEAVEFSKSVKMY